jgi:hypothetical protein
MLLGTKLLHRWTFVYRDRVRGAPVAIRSKSSKLRSITWVMDDQGYKSDSLEGLAKPKAVNQRLPDQPFGGVRSVPVATGPNS